MTATKLKLAFSTLVVAGAATAFVIQNQAQEKLRAENEALAQQITQLKTDNANFSSQLTNIADSKKLSDDQFTELLKLRGEVGILQNKIAEFEKLNERDQNIIHALANAKEPRQADTNSPPIFQRTFKIDLPTVLQNINRTMPSQPGESSYETIVRFIKQNGIEINPPDAIFLNDRLEQLYAHTSQTNLGCN